MYSCAVLKLTNIECLRLLESNNTIGYKFQEFMKAGFTVNALVGSLH
jgi:hypothetical protein